MCAALLLLLAAPLPAVADEALDAMERIDVEVLAKSTRMWNGTPLPPYGAGQPELSVVRVTIPRGVTLPLHEHPYATAGVLLQGTLEVHTPAGERRRLRPGDGLIELVNQPHAGVNVGEEDAVIVVVYAGIAGQPVTRLLTGGAAGTDEKPL
jgi:quercetin dioxygenase-like cupin family protein